MKRIWTRRPELGDLVKLNVDISHHYSGKVLKITKMYLRKDNSIGYWCEEYGKPYPKGIGLSKSEYELTRVI
jgi:hypothetical protein